MGSWKISQLLLVATFVAGHGERGRLHSYSPKAQSPKPAAGLKQGSVDVYDPDPAHLWNRLYAALFVRTSKDGQTYGKDDLDPFLWRNSKYLLAGARHREIIALLDDFLVKHGENLIEDPLKKALLQRDLWAIFDWLAGVQGEVQEERSPFVAERRALRGRLARITGRVALSAEQIRALPDNFATAAAGEVFPPKHDPSQAEKAFLPPKLLDPDGPWVLLQNRAGDPIAPWHVRFFGGRSAFFVLMSLPEGRQATLDYLEKLRKFPNPLMPHPADRGRPGLGPILNPDLPQFPVGTQVALVRQMLLVDKKGTITPTRLIENIQIRVFRDIPRKENVNPERPERFDLLYSKQDFYEFQLRRHDLLTGKAGGLHPVGRQDKESAFHLFLGGLQDTKDPLENVGTAPSSGTSVILDSCNHCHGGPNISNGPGIHSLRSYRRGISQPPDLVEGSRRWEEEAAIRWKRQHSSWGLMLGLMESQERQ